MNIIKIKMMTKLTIVNQRGTRMKRKTLFNFNHTLLIKNNVITGIK